MRNVRVIAELIPCSSAPVRRRRIRCRREQQNVHLSLLVYGIIMLHVRLTPRSVMKPFSGIHSTPLQIPFPSAPRNISAPDGFILLIVFIFTAAPQSCQSVPFPNPRLCPPNFYASNKGNGGRMVDSILNPRWR